MKILLDECVTKKIKKYLEEFELSGVTEQGWSVRMQSPAVGSHNH
jgi:hypothetical protein